MYTSNEEERKQDEYNQGMIAMENLKICDMYTGSTISLYLSNVLPSEYWKYNSKKIVTATTAGENKLLLLSSFLGHFQGSNSGVHKGDLSKTLVKASFVGRRISEGGSYQQRILTEYLKGIQSRAEEIGQVKAEPTLQSSCIFILCIHLTLAALR
ncbi:uncharacterized protein LOC111379273 [Olea europaea var. sylvestris]|uniref:uncharacterized protein LOC111379273 n=1 Tax=Olea europaea var. sylvestris TaxID=158386 RepID=UPI000C1D4CA2|nr:uncharacterized protein LOC111379273 [Olea europaea var. sylvestris]